jgi:hypothetical protein
MKLHRLNVLCNPSITDADIKHMKLHILHAANNSGITDTGIEHMKLHIFIGMMVICIKHMKPPATQVKYCLGNYYIFFIIFEYYCNII